jgi:hypothetical protein
MPLWKPDPSYRHFLGENVISEQDRIRIISWLEYGTKICSDSILPVPHFHNESMIGSPDVVLGVLKPCIIPQKQDYYTCFAIPMSEDTDTYVSAIEIIPGNKDAIHHASAFLVTDANTIKQYYREGIAVCNCDKELNESSVLLTNWGRGYTGHQLPFDFGIKLPKGSVIALQIHYAAGHIGKYDSSKINLFLNKQKPNREVKFAFYNNMGIKFSPGEKKYYEIRKVIDEDISLVSILPHTHLLAKKIECYAISPTQDTIPLIRINDWDYFWQDIYTYPNPIKLPKESSIVLRVFFDNSSTNVNNPNTPPRIVEYGRRAQDEMLVLSFQYVKYMNDDEKISMDPN